MIMGTVTVMDMGTGVRAIPSGRSMAPATARPTRNSTPPAPNSDASAPAHFADGISVPLGGNNPRTISNLVVGAGDADVANPEGVSAFMYAWGQFIDHDLTLTRTDGVNDINIVVPQAIRSSRRHDHPDDPRGHRSHDRRRHIQSGHRRQHHYRLARRLDGLWLQRRDRREPAPADGHMITSAGDNLPIVDGMFVAGDSARAENPALTSLQTLFLREHNYQVDKLHLEHPNWSGDQLYDHARAIVTAEIANITYSEFLPNLLGDDALTPYTAMIRTSIRI